MLDNEARNVIEGLKSDIQQFSVNSLIPGGLVAFWNPSSDDFEVGCYASASKTEVARVELVRILSINEDRIATVLYQDGSTQYKDIKSLYSCNHGKTTLGKEILKIAKNFGFHKLKHNAERRAIIGVYALRFTYYCTDTLHRRTHQLFDALSFFFRGVFDVPDDTPIHLKEAISRMKSLFERTMQTLLAVADQHVHQVTECNQSPMDQTINDSTYKHLVVSMLQGDKSSDNGTIALIYYQVLAFIKIQKQVISNTGAKMIKTFVLSTLEEFKKLLRLTLLHNFIEKLPPSANGTLFEEGKLKEKEEEKEKEIDLMREERKARDAVHTREQATEACPLQGV